MMALACLCGRVEAQLPDGFRIDRFRPAPTSEDGLGVQYARTLGHLVPSVGVVLDYAHDPLVARDASGVAGELVSHRVLAHVSGALGIADFLELHVRVPVAFSAGNSPVVGGFAFASADVVSIGDGALGGSLTLFSEGRRGFSLGLVAEALLPWGSTTSYASDTDFSARGQLLGTLAFSQVTLSASVGGIGRFERQISFARSGSEIEYALGVRVPTTPDLDVFIEAVGAVFVAPSVQSHISPLEAMLGARGRLGGSGFSIEGGLGAGFSEAPGVPDVRAMLGVRWTMPPPPPTDTDGDGFIGAADACPDHAEDVDGWEDGDGCPDLDDDNDGWLDEDDACPRAAEDRDGHADTDGCPDLDDDGDGIPDTEDQCPRSPGESFQRGCPQMITASVDRITLTWPIDFAVGSSVLPISAGGALEEIARTLAVDDTRARWRIAVRISSGSHDGSALAHARAAAIVSGLLTRGVEATRLEAATLPAGPGDAIEITNLGGTVRPATPPPRPAAPERPPPVTP